MFIGKVLSLLGFWFRNIRIHSSTLGWHMPLTGSYSNMVQFNKNISIACTYIVTYIIYVTYYIFTECLYFYIVGIVIDGIFNSVVVLILINSVVCLFCLYITRVLVWIFFLVSVYMLK